MGRHEQTKALRELGFTYDQIGQILKVTKQAAWQSANSKGCADWFQHVTPERCVYKGLRDWMNENRVNLSEMLRRANIPKNRHSSVAGALRGETQPKKDLIDTILKTTGLTYEQAFGGGDE
jgi:hypothetical protein